MTRKFEDKLANTLDWLEITNYHWNRLKGQLYNDTQAWDDTFHAKQDSDWWDIHDCIKVLMQMYPDEARAYPHLTEDFKEVEKRLLFGKPVIKPQRKSYNFTPFRAWMASKDFLNTINGSPTVDYTIVTPDPEDDKPTQFQTLFEFK